MPEPLSAGTPPGAAAARPMLIYDGDCGFCGYWARYWQALTGDRVSYRPYQEVEAQFPAIPRVEFQRAVQYIPPDGPRASAAEASFLTLSQASGKDVWLRLYRRFPLFAALAEHAYAFTAAHRPAFYRLSVLLCGRRPEPARYELVSFLFLRLFGLIYLAAFVSFAVQAEGLIGSHGILPVAELVHTLSERVGPARFYWLPMVFWWNSSDLALRVVCAAGIVLSLLLVLNVLPRVSLALLYVLYLSLLSAGQDFMTYQWDIFLLEAGFLAFLMSYARGTGLWLLRWLLFRFMFMSGMVKVLSDANWRNLSALSYHFLTQPLPTPLAWYAAQLPPAALRAATAVMLVIELALPFLIFLPRRPRRLAAVGILLLQGCIVLTGNYNWFNLQTMLLCLLLFDDAALRHIVPQRLLRAAQRLREPRVRSDAGRVALAALAGFLVLLSLLQMALRFEVPVGDAAQALVMYAEPLHLVSPYGLFAVMTTERDEIVIEGSDDGRVWREYAFRYKPGELARRPPWNIPHQPRLDWQMWFAALEDPRQLRWFWRFLQKLLENDPAVTALLLDNPFPDHGPRYLRAQFYDYTYADAAQKARGLWWQRRLLGPYAPVVQLGNGASSE
jgi:predicted DCC family thiol-disulfide oxidoreductase YuxK